ARDAVGGDVTVRRVQAQRSGLFEPDAPHGGLDPALPEPAGTADVAHLHLRRHLRTAGQADGHLDGLHDLAGVVEGTRLGTGHPQHAVGILDPYLLSAFDVVLVGLIAG